MDANDVIKILIIGFLALLALLWFLLPFAIFGTKDLLQTLINESIKTRESIDKLTETLKGNERER